mmetsp:Transcript_22276/g.72208  ORF Transcript_22276/g.72208 Transcript_22276/m.72208 type:complete len:280 (+) Transcript_22276:1796-2635(+)
MLFVEQIAVGASHALDDDEVASLDRMHASRAHLRIGAARDAAVGGAVADAAREGGTVRHRGAVELKPRHRAAAVMDRVQILVVRAGIGVERLDRIAFVVLPEALLLAVPAPDKGGVPIRGPRLVVAPEIELEARVVEHHNGLREGDEKINLVVFFVRPVVLPVRRVLDRGSGRADLDDVRGAHVVVRGVKDRVHLLRGRARKIVRRHVAVDGEDLIVEVRAVSAEDRAEVELVASPQGVRSHGGDVRVGAPRGAGRTHQRAHAEHVAVLVVLAPNVWRV